MKILNFDIQRFADISNSTDNTIVTGTADADGIRNYGADYKNKTWYTKQNQTLKIFMALERRYFFAKINAL